MPSSVSTSVAAPVWQQFAPAELVAGALSSLLHVDTLSPWLIASVLLCALALLVAVLLLLLTRCSSRRGGLVAPKENSKEPVRVCRAAAINAAAGFSECGALLPSNLPRSDAPAGAAGVALCAAQPTAAPTGATPHPACAAPPAVARTGLSTENAKAVTIVSDVEEGARGGGWGDLGGFEGMVRDEYPTTRRPERNIKEDLDPYGVGPPPAARRGAPAAGAPAAARKGSQKGVSRFGRR